MDKLRNKTTKILLNAIENKQFTDKEINKIMIANPEILLQISSHGTDGYDFEETFKVTTNESTGKQSIYLPIPSTNSEASPPEKSSTSMQSCHESLKEELYAEKNNLHNFLLK